MLKVALNVFDAAATCETLCELELSMCVRNIH